MSLNGESVKGAVRGLLAAVDSTDKARADQLAVKRVISVGNSLALNTSFNGGNPVTVLPALDRPIRVTAVKGCASAAQASAAADGWVFAVKYDDGAGGASTSVATRTVTATAISANTTFSFTTTNSAPVDIASGKRVFILYTATNTAAAANAMHLGVQMEYEET